MKGAFAPSRRGGTEFSAGHATDRFKSEAEAQARHGRRSPAPRPAPSPPPRRSAARSRRPRRSTPPRCRPPRPPRASRPARTMRIAESLYMDGLISYPRVDNTVYPASLDLQGILDALAEVPVYREHVDSDPAGRRAAPHARRQGDDRPPADPPRRPRPIPTSSSPRSGSSTTSSRAASWRRCRTRRSSRARRSPSTWRASRSWPRATSSSSPGFRAHLPVRPEEGRAAAGARRGRRRRLPRRRAGAEADRAAVALQPGQAHPGDGEARAGHQGDAPRDHRAPHRGRATRSTSRSSPRAWAARSSTRSRRSRRASPRRT